MMVVPFTSGFIHTSWMTWGRWPFIRYVSYSIGLSGLWDNCVGVIFQIADSSRWTRQSSQEEDSQDIYRAVLRRNYLWPTFLTPYFLHWRIYQRIFKQFYFYLIIPHFLYKECIKIFLQFIHLCVCFLYIKCSISLIYDSNKKSRLSNIDHVIETIRCFFCDFMQVWRLRLLQTRVSGLCIFSVMFANYSHKKAAQIMRYRAANPYSYLPTHRAIENIWVMDHNYTKI